ALVLDRDANRTFEAVIDLGARKTVSWKPVVGAQPNLLLEELDDIPELVRADQRWQKAVRDRGFKDEDLDKMHMETWAVTSPPTPGGKTPPRLIRVVTYYRGDAAHGYGRPVEGLLALVDANANKVIAVEDHGKAPRPSGSADFFDPAVVGRRRPPLKPLEVRRPKGGEFEVRGHQARLPTRSFRHALHPR